MTEPTSAPEPEPATADGDEAAIAPEPVEADKGYTGQDAADQGREAAPEDVRYTPPGA